MRIGYVLKKFPRLSETFILNELLALEAQGVEIDIFSIREPDDEPRHAALDRLQASTTVVRPLKSKSIFRHLEDQSRETGEAAIRDRALLYSRLSADDPWNSEALACALALKPLIEEREITHLHAHFATIAVAVAAETAALAGIPFSFTMHAKDIYRNTVSFDLLSRRLREAAFAVTVCEANATWLRSKCSRGACENLQVVYNGIELERWQPPTTERERAVFLAVGRLVEKKGFDDFLRACRLVKDAGYEFKAGLIGVGDQQDRLLRMRSELGLESMVEMPGALPREDVRKLLERATLLVAPCVRAADGNVDALPTVILEAMALARPCIATRLSGIPEIITRTEEGWLIEPRSPDIIAQLMIHAINHPEEVAAKGQAARERIESRFESRCNVAELARLMFDSSSRSRRARVAAGA